MKKHYIIHNGEKIYFKYGLDGVQAACDYCKKHGIKDFKIHTEK